MKIRKLIKINFIPIGVIFLLVFGFIVGGTLYYLFWSGTPRQLDAVFSPSGKRVIAPSVNMSKEDLTTYLCVYIEVKEVETGKVMFAQQTDASVRMRYSFRWISEDFIQMKSSDIGNYCWREGSGGVWEPTECPFEPMPTRTIALNTNTSTPTKHVSTPTIQITHSSTLTVAPADTLQFHVIQDPLYELEPGIYMVYLKENAFVVQRFQGPLIGKLKIPEVYRFAASYNPKMKRIAYQNTDSRISIYDLVDGDIQSIAYPPEILTAGSPSWSPDGNQLAYSALTQNGDQGRENVYITDIQEKDTFRLAPWELSEGKPIWSQDGKWFAFSSSNTEFGGKERKIMMVNSSCLSAGSTCAHNLLPLEKMGVTYSAEPVFNPESNQIAFTCKLKEEYGICIYSITGKTMTRFYKVSMDYIYGLNWSPDGKYIAFSSNSETNHGDIYLLMVNTGEFTNLTNTPKEDELFSFWLQIPD